MKSQSLLHDGRLNEAIEHACGIRLPKSLSVFFPFDDGRQDIMHRQDFGLAPFIPAYRRAHSLISQKAARKTPSVSKNLLLGYLDLFLGRYLRAQQCLLEVLSESPKNFYALFLYGMSLWLEGDARRTRMLLPQAYDAINAALALKPSHLYSLLLRAIIRREMEDEEGRLADIEKILSLKPDLAWALAERVEILGETGRYKEGLTAAGKLIKKFPSKAWSWAHRSRVHAFSGHYGKAYKDLSRALELDPASGAIRSWRAEALRRLGKYNEALKDLRLAARHDNGYAPVHLWTGRIYLQLGKSLKALPCFEQALKEDSRETLGHAWRAEALWKLGLYREACEGFASIYPAQPQSSWNARVRQNQAQQSGFLYGKNRSGKNRAAAFWNDLNAAARRHPRDPWVRLLRGQCRMDAGRLEDGLKDLNEAVRLAPASAWAWALKAETLRRMGRLPEALADIEKSLLLNPKSRWAWAWQGRILFALGRKKDAVNSLERALKGNMDQRFALIHIWKGEALWNLQKQKLSLKEFAEAFCLDGRLKKLFQINSSPDQTKNVLLKNSA